MNVSGSSNLPHYTPCVPSSGRPASGPKVITFFDKKREFRCLSNFWECKVVIEDGDDIREYGSGELCFHGEKYIRLSKIYKDGRDDNRRKILFEYGRKFLVDGEGWTSKEAKMKGGKRGLRLTLEELNSWYNISMDVQISICKYKLENFIEVKNWLSYSADAILIHPALRCGVDKMKDKIWEGKFVERVDGFEILGENRLGNIWMNLRNTLL